MKRLLVASLVLSVSGVALAANAVDKSSVADRQIRMGSTNLATTLVRHEAASTTPVDLGSTRVDGKTVFASEAHAEYAFLKNAGLPIPEALRLELFGPVAETSPLRDGGDDSGTATAIAFSAGGVYTDSGSTADKTDVMPTNQTAPATCNTSFYASSSFGSADAWYSFTLPDSYEVSASVCDAADYDTCLGIFDSEMNLVAVNDDNNVDCTNFTSQINPCCLPAGDYYVVVDGYGADEVGAYDLTVEFGAAPCMQGDACGDAPSIACGDVQTGSTVGMENFVGNAAGDFFVEVTIDADGPITFSLCDGGTDYDSYLRLYDDCPTEGGVELAGNDDSCGLQSELVAVLTAGTYWVVVEGFSASEGNFSLEVICSSCDPLECDGQAEVEPNDGPNGDPEVYDTIDCGVTVCGTTWADGGTRDTDFYELLLLAPSIITIQGDAESFDPVLIFTDEAINVLASANNTGFCESETLVTNCVDAGTYYVFIAHNGFEGVPDEQGYALTVTCAPCEIQDPCENPYPIACNESQDGDNSMSQAGHVWDTYCNNGEDGPEVVYELTHSGGFLTINMTSVDGEDLDMALLGSCDPLDCLEMPWAVGPNETISGVFDAGVYYLAVDCYGWSGGDYTYSLEVICGDDPCEDLPPVECDGTPESEPNEGWNADPPNDSYGTITCNETVCGTVWADGGNRDLDWYRFVHTGGDIEITTVIGQFDAILFLTDFASDGAIITSANNAPMCEPESMTVSALPAGEYYVVIAHTDFEGVPNEEDYALTVSCLADPCEDHTPITCDGTAEVEPNEGWNADPPNDNYGTIADGETVCGTTWADAGTRDTDWFTFDLEETMNVTVTAEIDWFDAILFITDFDSDGSILTAADNEGACTAETLTYECLDAGSYFVAIMNNDFEGVPDEENYSLSLSFGECVPVDPCADIHDAGTLDDVYTISRPAPIANHHNAVNGCDGISSAGYDELHMLVVTEDTDVRITHQGQGTADEVLYILTDCNFTESCLASVDAGGSDTAPEVLTVNGLEAGTYYIVADYWGSAETHPYTLTVDDLSIAVGDGVEPLAFELAQNYPNPFNPVTTIQWTQPELTRASLTVYNLLGEAVQTFDLGFRGAGVQTFVWDASQLSSGVYLYNLTTGTHSETAKAILLK